MRSSSCSTSPVAAVSDTARKCANYVVLATVLLLGRGLLAATLSPPFCPLFATLIATAEEA